MTKVLCMGCERLKRNLEEKEKQVRASAKEALIRYRQGAELFDAWEKMIAESIDVQGALARALEQIAVQKREIAALRRRLHVQPGEREDDWRDEFEEDEGGGIRLKR